MDFFKIFRGVGGPPGGSPGARGDPKTAKNGMKSQNYEFLEIGPYSPNETS